MPRLTVVDTHDDVRRLALSLPEVTEAAAGDLAFEVAGKRFVWLWPERVHPTTATGRCWSGWPTRATTTWRRW